MPMRALYMRLGQGTIFSVHPVFPDSQSFPSILLAPGVSSPSTHSTPSTPASLAPPRAAARALLPLTHPSSFPSIFTDQLQAAEPSTLSTPSTPPMPILKRLTIFSPMSPFSQVAQAISPIPSFSPYLSPSPSISLVLAAATPPPASRAELSLGGAFSQPRAEPPLGGYTPSRPTNAAPPADTSHGVAVPGNSATPCGTRTPNLVSRAGPVPGGTSTSPRARASKNSIRDHL